VNWLAMLVLGMQTQVAAAVVQLERLPPQALALFHFTTAFTGTVMLIGLVERPFTYGRSMNCRSAWRSSRWPGEA
jgi:hypothetical protein